METLKKRLSEVEDQPKEQTASVGALTQERDRLLEARTMVEEALPKERDGTVQKLEVATRTHERALLAAQG